MGKCFSQANQSKRKGEQTSTIAGTAPESRPSLHQVYKQETELNRQSLRQVQKEEMRDFHRWIGALTFQTPNGTIGKSSAVLISKNLILTAAHSVYNHKYQTKYTNFKFYLAPCGIVEQYYEIEPISCHYPIQFETCPFEDRYIYEYAIMKLKRDYEGPVPSNSFPPLSMTCYECHTSNLKSSKLSIYGYPIQYYLPNYISHDEEEKSIELYQYGLTRENRVQSIDPSGRITYTISTLTGQSGSPILSENEIIGVHFGGGTQANIGRLVTPNFIEKLESWRQELNGCHFTIKLKNGCKHIPSVICKVWDTLQHQQDDKSEVVPQISIKAISQTIIPSHNSQKFDKRHLIQTKEQKEARILSILKKAERQEKLWMNMFGLDQIDMRRHVILKELSLFDNNLTSVDLRENEFLTKLWLGKNKIQKIDLSYNKRLTYLGLSENRLSTIDLQDNKQLSHIYLSNNLLKNLDFSRNKKTVVLQLRYNLLEGATVWYSDKLFINLENQKSERFELRMLHRQGEERECSAEGELFLQEFDSKKYNCNIYNCVYSFIKEKSE